MMSLIFVFYTVNVFTDLIFFGYNNVGNVYDESMSFFVRICTYCTMYMYMIVMSYSVFLLFQYCSYLYKEEKLIRITTKGVLYTYTVFIHIIEPIRLPNQTVT